MISEKDFNKIIGDKLKTFRQVMSLTQIEVADSIGVYQSHYSRAEKGCNKISIYNLYALMVKYDLNPNYLFMSGEKMIDLSKNKLRIQEENEYYKKLLKENDINF